MKKNETLDFTFLNEDQIWGDDALDVMKRYGVRVAPTDLTVILGGFMTMYGNRTSEGDLACESWSASSYADIDVRYVNSMGNRFWDEPDKRRTSARPVLPPSEASKISPIEARAIAGIRVAEYGQYPQTVADDVTCEKLERLHSSSSLRLSGKNYTFDSDYDTAFKATSFPEYEMDGKRYIRVPGRPYDYDSKLSTGKQVEKGKPYWVEVQPIEWLMDRSGTMVAKKGLFAGIQFDTKDLYDGDFSKTSMKHYLDTYFAKEMEPTERSAEREGEKKKKIDAKLGGLKAKLKQLEDKEEIKKKLTARTPERLEKATEIKQNRLVREALLPVYRQILSEKNNLEVRQAFREMIRPYMEQELKIKQEFTEKLARQRREKGK